MEEKTTVPPLFAPSAFYAEGREWCVVITLSAGKYAIIEENEMLEGEHYDKNIVYLPWEHLPLDEVTADYQAYQPFKSSDLLPIYYS